MPHVTPLPNFVISVTLVILLYVNTVETLRRYHRITRIRNCALINRFGSDLLEDFICPVVGPENIETDAMTAVVTWFFVATTT